MKNSQKAPKLTEEKTQISNESKIQWEIPNFEEIDVEGGVPGGGVEGFGYSS